MNITAVFARKESEFYESECAIEKVIELSVPDYLRFRSNMLADYDFISDNADIMHNDADGVKHCILVMGEGINDGVLVDSQGYSYARYTAFLPEAHLIIKDQLQSKEPVSDDEPVTTMSL